MELRPELLKQFAKLTTEKSKQNTEGMTTYGTIVFTPEGLRVRLDGSSVDTPVIMTMDAQVGDRVMVMIKNHTATIVGNVTSPASARTASSFLRLIDAGLVVGRLNESGNPVGTYSLISPGIYSIVDDNGMILASFSVDRISLGEANSSVISLCNGAGEIAFNDGVLRLEGEDAVGLRSIFESANGDYRAEMVCKADSTNPVAAVQSFDHTGTGCVLQVKPNGAYVNGDPIVATDAIMVTGSIKGTGAIAAGTAKTISKVVSVADGYKLAGIRHISTNYVNKCNITQFSANPKTKEVSVTLKNTGTTDISNLEVRIIWFAILSKDLPEPTDEKVVW